LLILNILVYLTMKTAIYFIFSCFISTGAFLAALSGKHPFALYIVGFGIWALFLWSYSTRSKKEAERRNGERLFQDYMRAQTRNFRR